MFAGKHPNDVVAAIRKTPVQLAEAHNTPGRGDSRIWQMVSSVCCQDSQRASKAEARHHVWVHISLSMFPIVGWILMTVEATKSNRGEAFWQWSQADGYGVNRETALGKVPFCKGQGMIYHLLHLLQRVTGCCKATH